MVRIVIGDVQTLFVTDWSPGEGGNETDQWKIAWKRTGPIMK